MSEEKSSQRSSTSIFLMGAAVGAVIALLYAPKSGAETRELLAKKGKELKNRAQETLETAQEFIHDRKEDIVAALDSAKEIGHDSKHKRS